MRIEDDHKHFVTRCNHIRQRLPADLIPIAARKLAAFFRKPSQVFNSLFVVRRRTGKKSLAVKNSHFPPQPDKVLHKTDVRDFLIADGVPDHIRNNIVLAVSIVIAELRIQKLVAGTDNRRAERKQQRTHHRPLAQLAVFRNFLVFRKSRPGCLRRSHSYAYGYN